MLAIPKRPVCRSVVAALVLASACGAPSGAEASAAAETHAVAGYGKIPLSFEVNSGQIDPQVRFLARGEGYALFLTDDEAVIKLAPKSAAGLQTASPTAPAVLRMKLLGAQTPKQVTGAQPLAGTANYFIGNDPSQWRKGVHSFGRVDYQAVYPGVDLVYYGNQRQLEYDFVVAPGADASRIALAFDGAKPHLDAQGDLVLPVKGDAVRFHKPVVYQLDGDSRRPIEASYLVAGNRTRFKIGAYDHAKPLIIDPVLSYVTYLGGSDSDFIGSNADDSTSGSIQGQGIAVDSEGSVYVTGSTVSTDFPLKGAYQSAYPHSQQGHTTGFVTKINPAGTGFVYSTYLGGTGDVIDYSLAIAVDATGSAYVVGGTNAQTFPVTANALQKICAPAAKLNNAGATIATSTCGYSTNAFVTKLSPDGASLVYSTYLGGADYGGGDVASGITVDTKGQAYVVGVSSDECHPGAVAANYGNGNFLYSQSYECFPTTANAFVKGTENDYGSGNVDFDGNTAATHPAHQENNGFLAVLTADGSGLIYSTLLSHPTLSPGSIQYHLSGSAVAIDPSGNVYVAGQTQTATLSATPGAFQTTTGPISDASTQVIPQRSFIEKFGAVGAGASGQPVYVSFVGGNTSTSGSYPTGITADADGNAYLYGHTAEVNFPTTTGAYQTTCGRYQGDTLCNSAYVAKIKPDGSGLVWSSFLGDLMSGSGSGAVPNTTGIAIDAARNVYVVGTSDNSFPQVNPIQTNNGGNYQAFIAKFDPAGSTLLFATNVGSGGAVGTQRSNGLALDGQGNIYLAGSTNTANSLPVTAGAAQGTFAGGTEDGFIAKIAPFLSSSTTLALSATSAVAGTPVTFTATVTGPTGSAVPTGSVSFANGGTAMGSSTLDSTGKATMTSSTLAAGSYNVIASYAGDGTYSPSVSAPQTVTVTAPVVPTVPTVTISSSPNSIVLGASASLTWSSTGATACTASGSWSGAEATSGTASVTPTAAGTASYALTCTGAGGSAKGTASLTVTAPPAPPAPPAPTNAASHHGGGAMNPLALLGLGLLAGVRCLRRRQDLAPMS